MGKWKFRPILLLFLFLQILEHGFQKDGIMIGPGFGKHFSRYGSKVLGKEDVVDIGSENLAEGMPLMMPGILEGRGKGRALEARFGKNGSVERGVRGKITVAQQHHRFAFGLVDFLLESFHLQSQLSVFILIDRGIQVYADHLDFLIFELNLGNNAGEINAGKVLNPVFHDHVFGIQGDAMALFVGNGKLEGIFDRQFGQLGIPAGLEFREQHHIRINLKDQVFRLLVVGVLQIQIVCQEGNVRLVPRDAVVVTDDKKDKGEQQNGQSQVGIGDNPVLHTDAQHGQ